MNLAAYTGLGFNFIRIHLCAALNYGERHQARVFVCSRARCKIRLAKTICIHLPFSSASNVKKNCFEAGLFELLSRVNKRLLKCVYNSLGHIQWPTNFLQYG